MMNQLDPNVEEANGPPVTRPVACISPFVEAVLSNSELRRLVLTRHSDSGIEFGRRRTVEGSSGGKKKGVV
jgi:hypothetical protein